MKAGVIITICLLLFVFMYTVYAQVVVQPVQPFTRVVVSSTPPSISLPSPFEQEGTQQYLPYLPFLLPISHIDIRFNVTYSPLAQDFTHTVVYTVNASTTGISVGNPHDWAWRIYVVPYYNNTGWVPVDKNATLLGTWISGTVSDLSAYDYVWMKFQSYNDTNTMRLYLTFNVTTLGWLGSDLSSIRIRDIIIYVAGNVSKYINTKASLEILNWTSNTWVTIDAVAFNQTSDAEKSYDLASILGGNLNDLVSSTGVVAFRINITDVQTYPSTYVYFTIDELKVLIDYVNATDASTVSRIVITFLPNSTVHVEKLTFYVKTNGTGRLRQLTVTVTNASGINIVTLQNVSMSKTWTPVTVPINVYTKNNITLTFNIHVTSSLDTGEEIDIANVKLYVNGTGNFTVIFACLSPAIEIHRAYRQHNFNCILIIQFIEGLDFVNTTVLNFTVPRYFKLTGAEFVEYNIFNVTAFSRIVNNSNIITILNVPGIGFLVVFFNDTIYGSIDKNGVVKVGWFMPKGTHVPMMFTLPTPFLFIQLDNGTVLQIDRTFVIIGIVHDKEFKSLKLYYGKYFNATFYMWVNLSNPTVSIKYINFTDSRLTAVVILSGLGEFNVYTLKLPTEILVDEVHAVAVPDYSSYRACTPPCYWYDPVTHILHVKIRGHSPVTIVVDWTRPMQVTVTPTVKSVRLTFDKTTVHVNEPVHYTVTVQLYEAWSGELTYALTCTGPEPINMTGKVTVSEGRGTATGYVTFKRTGTYACYVKVLDTYSPTVYVHVIERAVTPTLSPWFILVLIALLVLVIVIIAVAIKRRRTGSGGGTIIVRLNI